VDVGCAEFEFAARLSYQIDRHGAAALAAAAGVTPSAVSQWGSGATLPGAAKVEAVAESVEDPELLELWLLASGVPPTVARLGRLARRPAEKRLAEYEGRSSYRRLARMADRREHQRTRQLHEIHHVGPDGRPARHRTRQVLEAVGPVSEYFYAFDLSVAHNWPPSVNALVGCTVGLTNFAPDGMCAVELRLDGDLVQAEHHLIEYETVFAYSETPPSQFRRDMSRLVDGLYMRVEFAPGRVPKAAYRCECPADADVAHDIEELRVRGGVVQAVFTPGGPRVRGVRWAW
jgi:transcriptional regulator with XRE-family HTH domain